MVVEGVVVVERDGGIIEGDNGGGGEREGKGRRKPNRSDVDVEESSIKGVLRPQFLGAGWWLGGGVARGGYVSFDCTIEGVTSHKS